jgi:hypothetical protein
MADITPSRIEPLGDSPDSQPGTPKKEPGLKSKLPVKPDPDPEPDPPPLDDENDESHHLDELA